MFKTIENKNSKLTSSYWVDSRGGGNALEEQGVKEAFLKLNPRP